MKYILLYSDGTYLEGELPAGFHKQHDQWPSVIVRDGYGFYYVGQQRKGTFCEYKQVPTLFLPPHTNSGPS